MKNIPTPQRIIEIKRKRRIYRLRLVILFLILFISLAGSLAYFSSYKKFTINNIIITGTSIIDDTEVIFAIKKQLEGNFFHLYSRANSFIFPNKQIYNDLITTFPRIKELSIVHKNTNTIYIKIKERDGSYLYCGEVIPETEGEIGENCYFINNDGYIFDKAPYFSGNVYFKYYVKLSEGEINPLGKNVLSSSIFHELVRFIDGITTLGLSPSSLYIDNNGIYSLYLEHKQGEANPRIIFRKDNDLERILSNLSTAMNKSEFTDEIKAKYSNLLYIDLRFKSKVLYKFQ